MTVVKFVTVAIVVTVVTVGPVVTVVTEVTTKLFSPIILFYQKLFSLNKTKRE